MRESAVVESAGLREAYLDAARDGLAVLRSQYDALEQAAALVVAAYHRGRTTWLCGSGHSGMLAQELVLRAGGLPCFTQLVVAGLLLTDEPPLRSTQLERLPGVAKAALDTSPVEAGDVIVVISNSGRNAVPVELALEGKNRGLSVVALTSLTMSSAVSSRHASGQRLFELADVVLDTGAPLGDATVALPGSSSRLAPLSTVLGAALLQLLACTVAEQLIARGEQPTAYPSGNLGS